MAKYNGWANYNTWKLVVNLDNIEPNYNKMVSQGKHLLKLKRKELIQEIMSNYYIVDSINTSKLSSRDIKRYIEDVLDSASYTLEDFVHDFVKLDSEKSWKLEEIKALYKQQLEVYGVVDEDNTNIEYAIKNKNNIELFDFPRVEEEEEEY